MNKVVVASLLSLISFSTYAQAAGNQSQWSGILICYLLAVLFIGLLIHLVNKKRIFWALIVTIVISVLLSISILIYLLSNVYGVN